MQKLRVTFVSNYINHHQIPFCNAMSKLQDVDFSFVQTEKMAEERVQMGWNEAERPSYVKCYYEEEAYCKNLIADSDVVLFGGVDEEGYIAERLKSGKMIIRISERLYKTGQWKAISPRGLKKKYMDHTQYRKASVYLLCAGGYVASDFHIVRAYPDKMYAWGYFPETERFDVDKVLKEKGYICPSGSASGQIPYLLWAGRMIDWKHPELAVETAKYLRDKGLAFHMDIIGGGELAPAVEELIQNYHLEDKITLLGYQNPKEVRRYMKKADIFLFTSDRQEGWGAVANEAMNSGCALVANHMIGAVPYLVQNGENGLVYVDGNNTQLFEQAEKLVGDRQLCRKLGRNAYQTITEVWNAENAAESLLRLIAELRGDTVEVQSAENIGATKTACDRNNRGCQNSNTVLAPCAPAPVQSERSLKKYFEK